MAWLAIWGMAPLGLLGQGDPPEYYESRGVRLEDYVYAGHIKSVVLEKEGIRLSDPAIAFGSQEQLRLEFDDLGEGGADYSYRFVHCNSDWTPTNIPVSYYLGGFTEDRIVEYAYSFNTRQSYTHFTLLFPNQNMQPLISGNYVLHVFETDRPDSLVLTRRWLYYENSLQVEAVVKRATVIADRYTRQEVDFTVNYAGSPVSNPFSELKVILMQNSRWDQAITGLKPLYIKGTLLDYNYDEGNTFNGGNEFRTFDTRSYRTANRYMKSFLEDSTGLYAYVNDDFSKAAYRYSIEDDINGKFLVSMYEGRDASLEADYLHIQFKLLAAEPFTDGTPYLFGALTGWRLLPEAKLKYDYVKQAYEASLYLKQGFYNYQYVMLRDGIPHPDATIIEGNHFETENDYTILVYYLPPGARYERLVVFRRFSSRNIY